MITVIGVDGSPLRPRAAAAVSGATLVVGGRRHLAAVPVAAGVRTLALGELAPALDALAAHDGDAAVLASGDPGFFGIVRALRERGLAPAVLPAPSSVSTAFARAGQSWDDSVVVSAHGRDLGRAVNVCRAHPKVAVLTGPGAGPAEIGAALAGWERRLIVCERLGAPGERITECGPAAAAVRDWEQPNVVLVLADGGPGGSGQPGEGGHHGWPPPGPGWIWPRSAAPDGWALPEDRFDSRDAVITKAEVRALALARLAPGPGTLVWDVGAGAGTVAVECARFGAAVAAIERDPRRSATVRANARRHRVDVRVVEGEAPAALAGLPAPDAFFLGGGGRVVAAAAAARRPARIVAAFAAMERAAAVHGALIAAGYRVEGTLAQSARMAPLPGGVHRLAPVNPVFLLWGTPADGPAPASRGVRR